jgi:hypothetical protein
VVSPRVEEVQAAGVLHTHLCLFQRRSHGLFVIDDKAEVPGLIGGLYPSGGQSKELVTLSMKAIFSPTWPRSSNSKNRPYQRSALERGGAKIAERVRHARGRPA